MEAFQVEIDAELAKLLQQLDQPVEQSAGEFLVLELYRRGHISSGKAAELLGMSRWTFIEYAFRLGIPFFMMTPDEWEAEQKQSELL